MLNVLFSTAFTTILTAWTSLFKTSDSDFDNVRLDYFLCILACYDRQNYENPLDEATKTEARVTADVER